MNLSTSKTVNSTNLSTDCIAYIACDVSKDTVNFVTHLKNRRIEDEFDNLTEPSELTLGQLKVLARQAGYENIVVVAEPTGIYHQNLFKVAERLGLNTAYVSAEAVAKMRLIETNDSGKTDIKDPNVIYTLAAIGKTLRHRKLPEPYDLLREYNKLYDTADSAVVAAKGAIHTLNKRLFADFSLSKDFVFSNSGKALMRHFKFNPFRIIMAGKSHFTKTMKTAVPRIRNRSLEKLYQQAQCSVKNAISPRQLRLMEISLQQRWQDLRINAQRKSQAKQAMQALYGQCRQLDANLPAAKKAVITTFHLARLVAETGPLSDFINHRKLMRFSGLNLCERQSGKYRGKTKISKKGRALLRKVLSLIVFPLVRKNGLYGHYYHRKKEKMPGNKAMTAVARHFLKMLYGWYRNGGVFNARRVFACESQFKLAA